MGTQKKRIWTTVLTKQSKKRSGPNYKVHIFGSFRTISWSDEFGSFFGLLRWDRVSNTLLLRFSQGDISLLTSPYPRLLSKYFGRNSMCDIFILLDFRDFAWHQLKTSPHPGCQDKRDYTTLPSHVKYRFADIFVHVCLFIFLNVICTAVHWYRTVPGVNDCHCNVTVAMQWWKLLIMKQIEWKRASFLNMHTYCSKDQFMMAIQKITIW